MLFWTEMAVVAAELVYEQKTRPAGSGRCAADHPPSPMFAPGFLLHGGDTMCMCVIRSNEPTTRCEVMPCKCSCNQARPAPNHRALCCGVYMQLCNSTHARSHRHTRNIRVTKQKNKNKMNKKNKYKQMLFSKRTLSIDANGS